MFKSCAPLQPSALKEHMNVTEQWEACISGPQTNTDQDAFINHKPLCSFCACFSISFFLPAWGLTHFFIFLYFFISFSWVEIRLHTEFQLPMLLRCGSLWLETTTTKTNKKTSQTRRWSRLKPNCYGRRQKTRQQKTR